MKKILSYTVGALLLSILLALCIWSFIEGRRADRQQLCRKVNISLNGSEQENFVSVEDLKSEIRAEFGDFRGRRLTDIDLCAVERFVDSRSAVLKSEVYVTRDSSLNIVVKQRQPVLRFIRNGQGCYSDDQGKLFPLQGKTSARVLAVDGEIPLDLNHNGRPESARWSRWLDKMVAFAIFVREEGWSGRISSVSVYGKGELKIYMTDTPEVFVFGTPDDIEAKFARISKWYTAVKPTLGDRRYRSVNVKFDRQLVCR